MERFTKSAFYAAFNEIDQMSRDYKGNPGELISELEINQKKLLDMCTVRLGGIVGWAKKFQNELVFEDEKTDAVGGYAEYLTKYFNNADEVNYWYTVWLNGFITYLVLQEGAGKHWDELDEAALDKLNTSLQPKLTGDVYHNIKDVVTERVISLLYATRGKPRPMVKPVLSKEDKRRTVMASAIFADGYMVASSVEFKSDEQVTNDR